MTIFYKILIFGIILLLSGFNYSSAVSISNKTSIFNNNSYKPCSCAEKSDGVICDLLYIILSQIIPRINFFYRLMDIFDDNNGILEYQLYKLELRAILIFGFGSIINCSWAEFNPSYSKIY